MYFTLSCTVLMLHMPQHGFSFTAMSSFYTRHFWYSLTSCELKSELTELPRFPCEPGLSNSFPFLFSSDFSPLPSELTFSSSTPLCFQEQEPRQVTVPQSPTVRLEFCLWERQCHRAFMEARGQLLRVSSSLPPFHGARHHMGHWAWTASIFTNWGSHWPNSHLFCLTSSDFDELRILSVWGVFIHP